jgi:Pvc16 N-terminal domain
MMSAIRDVGETLVELLRANLQGLAGGDLVALCSPTDANANANIRVGVFLYSINPAADLRNELEIPYQEGPNLVADQPLDLYYLVTCYRKTETDPTLPVLAAHLLLGQVMRIFFDHATLTGSILQGQLPRDQEIRLTHQPITVEDVTRLWGSLPNVALQPSVSYLASPVRIRSMRGAAANKVSSRRSDFAPMVPEATI